jgi:hypothetical protein
MNRRVTSDQGVALITALLAVMLASALMAGMFAALAADQRSQARDRDQSQAYAAAHAGLEKLTSSLAQLFVTDFSPSAAQVGAIDNVPPSIPGFTYTAPGGAAGSGYAVTFTPDANGNPASIPQSDITTGPFTGFKGLMTPYTLTVTARSAGGGEVRLRRDVQTVAVPVFQFGIFGEKSLSFHAGSTFDFGGRVHTNQHLFLAQGGGSTLTFRDRITVVGQVVRSQLANGNPIAASGHTGTVSVPTVIGSTYRNLASTEGSVQDGPASAAVPGWKSLSEDTYQTNIRNTMTGAKRLDLPLVSQGAVPIDLIRRPAVGSNENVANAPVFLQRYFAQASLRILLSDRAADITNLPTVTGTAPVAFDGDWIAAPPAGYTLGAPMARAIGGGAVGGAGYTTTLNAPTASTYAAPYHQIRVLAVPLALQIPLLTVGPNANIVCTGKTSNTFFGCALPANVNAGTVITATLPQGGTATATTVAPNATAGANKTLTVGANGTLPFSQDFAWINNKANDRPTPMTCEGYDTAVVPQLLKNCRILGVTAVQNTSGRVISTHSLGTSGASLLGGFLKIEKQDNAGAWTDVTAEILSLGFAGPNQEGTACADPTPNAVLRFQRLRDNGGACNYAGSLDARDYWPNVLFDAREASYRDLATTAAMTMGGVINYVTLDVGNLKRWLNGTIGTTGTAALNNNGYIVYFSDRRGNHNDAIGGAPETAEYGHEDSVNSAAGAASSASNGVLEGGEDRNEDGVLQTYGATPAAVVVADYGGSAPFSAASNPLTALPYAPQARVNRQVFFRRALKVRNGGISGGVNNLPDSGLTIATENGLYVEGNYNATSADVTAEPNRPAALIADAVTILSNSWTDIQSLNAPNDQSLRQAGTTGYRFGLIAGKSIEFTKPGWAALGNWGTDGGVHNFMRMLEDWSGEATNYRGSMVSLYTARQFIGIFKNNDNVYTQGTRNFQFDTDFLTPSLLPPGTPMFRDVNTMKFRQILRPNQ